MKEMEFVRASLVTAQMGQVTERDTGAKIDSHRNGITISELGGPKAKSKLKNPVLTIQHNQNDLTKVTDKARLSRPP